MIVEPRGKDTLHNAPVAYTLSEPESQALAQPVVPPEHEARLRTLGRVDNHPGVMAITIAAARNAGRGRLECTIQKLVRAMCKRTSADQFTLSELLSTCCPRGPSHRQTSLSDWIETPQTERVCPRIVFVDMIPPSSPGQPGRSTRGPQHSQAAAQLSGVGHRARGTRVPVPGFWRGLERPTRSDWDPGIPLPLRLVRRSILNADGGIATGGRNSLK